MSRIVLDVIATGFMVFGTLLILLASVGVLRMPDLFLRMSAATKAATVGAAGLLIAAAMHFNEPDIIVQMVLTILFVLLTAPVGAHIIGRAAYKHKAKLYKNTKVDQLESYYQQDEL